MMTGVRGGAGSRIRIGCDDVDRLISYPDAHNLSANVLDEAFGGAQARTQGWNPRRSARGE